MWQSQVEIEYYSVVFSTVLLSVVAQTSIKGGAHMHYVDLLGIHVSMLHV